MTTPHASIPEDMLVDAHGRWVPKRLIKEVDLLRDELVRDIIGRAQALHVALALFKSHTMNDLQAFVDMSVERYGVAAGGARGNLTLHSFDGRYRIVRSVADTITFDERLQAAKVLIDECVREWAADASDNLRALVEHAFQVDSTGKVSTERVLGLRKLEIETPRWTSAMKAISDSIHVTSSKAYVRLYERDAQGGWRSISLDLASIVEAPTASEVAP